MGLLTTVKGLPGGYNRDLQEDRAAAARDRAAAARRRSSVLRLALPRVTFDPERCRAARRRGLHPGDRPRRGAGEEGHARSARRTRWSARWCAAARSRASPCGRHARSSRASSTRALDAADARGARAGRRGGAQAQRRLHRPGRGRARSSPRSRVRPRAAPGGRGGLPATRPALHRALRRLRRDEARFSPDDGPLDRRAPRRCSPRRGAQAPRGARARSMTASRAARS